MNNDFDGFVMPDGELVSIKEVDRVFSIFTKGNEDLAKIKRSLNALAMECMGKGYCQAAYGYFDRLLSLTDDTGEQVKCLLLMGTAGEKGQNYAAALNAYARALQLPPASDELRYFLPNNAAYCLNQLGRYSEAEKCCRVAIEIDPHRHNAYKNLGVALQNLGQYAESARCLMQSAKLHPADGRALEHLKVLIADHPEVSEEISDLMELFECGGMVQVLRENTRCNDGGREAILASISPPVYWWRSS